MLTQILVDNQAITATTQSASANFHMPKSVRGIVQYTATTLVGSMSVAFKLQGKLTEDHEWVDVVDTTKTLNAVGTDAAEDITLYPIMRCYMLASGTGTLTVLVHVGC
jgi:hypothetical protein